MDMRAAGDRRFNKKCIEVSLFPDQCLIPTQLIIIATSNLHNMSFNIITIVNIMDNGMVHFSKNLKVFVSFILFMAAAIITVAVLCNQLAEVNTATL